MEIMMYIKSIIDNPSSAISLYAALISTCALIVSLSVLFWDMKKWRSQQPVIEVIQALPPYFNPYTRIPDHDYLIEFSIINQGRDDIVITKYGVNCDYFLFGIIKIFSKGSYNLGKCFYCTVKSGGRIDVSLNYAWQSKYFLTKTRPCIFFTRRFFIVVQHTHSNKPIKFKARFFS